MSQLIKEELQQLYPEKELKHFIYKKKNK